MKTLEERLRWVLDNRVESARQWSESAGLSAPYVSTMLTRLREGGTSPGVNEICALAKVADVPVGWLAAGEGEPSSVMNRPTHYVVELERDVGALQTQWVLYTLRSIPGVESVEPLREKDGEREAIEKQVRAELIATLGRPIR